MNQALKSPAIPDPYSIPLESIDMSDSSLYEAGAHWDYFARLRKEAPVHYCANSQFGPYWSVTKYEDIMAVDVNFELFSSFPSIVIGDNQDDLELENFISMDPPKHDGQRKAVVGAVSPSNLMKIEPLIRQRVQDILDSLPVGETFDWVDRVSIELTTQILATLFDFPFEKRRKLTYWSDMTTASPGVAGDDSVSEEERKAALTDCLNEFTVLWNERVNKDPSENFDFITMMAHAEATRNMKPMEFLGNLVLLIVGGNDTTRNSISGGVLALNRNPAEYDKLRADPSVIPKMVSEIIRYQTPLMHMRRLATADTVLNGQHIKKNDKVVMWYISGNRDGDKIENPDQFIIDRKNPRNHLSFGFGIHRCMGNRLGEMQLRILWEEIMLRFSMVEVVEEPTLLKSNFVAGITRMPVRLHPL